MTNIFRKIFKKKTEQRSVSEDFTLHNIWGANPDEVNSPTLSMKISAVFRCIEIVSGTVASLGIDIEQRKGNKFGTYYAPIEGTSLDYLLNCSPNCRYTAFEFWKNAVSMILLNGNAYILPIYGVKDIVALELLNPNAVNYDPKGCTYYVNDYTLGINGVFSSDEIIHLRNTSSDGGHTGCSTLEYAGRTLSIARRTDAQQNSMFAPGASLRGIVSGESSITEGLGAVQDHQITTAAGKIERAIASGKQIIEVPGAMKFSPLSLTPADLQLLDSKRFSVVEICRFFGVHPDKVFSQTSTNYQASQNSQTVFISDTLQPLLTRIENELQLKLIPRQQYRQMRIRFSFDNYFKTDLNSKADYYQKMIACGAMSVNDVRMIEGREPIENGDKIMVTCNVAPLDNQANNENLNN